MPKKRAQIDLTALGDKIAAAADEVKANDPKALRMRAVRAEKELAAVQAKLDKAATAPGKTRTEVQIETVEKIVEVPVLSADDAKMLADLVAETQAMSGRAAEIANLVAGTAATVTAAANAKPVPAKTARVAAPRTQPQPRTAPAPRQAAAPEPADSDVTLKAGARRIIETFARQHPQRLTKAQLGTLAQFKITGGTFQTYWVRSSGPASSTSAAQATAPTTRSRPKASSTSASSQATRRPPRRSSRRTAPCSRRVLVRCST